jgi:DNA-binding response OmpR family regulator
MLHFAARCDSPEGRVKMLRQSFPNILLADEDPGVRKSLEMVLTWAGYRVSTAEHTIDAILALQEIVPDLIIFDLDLAPVPGYDFLAVVRNRLPQVPVIATSIVGDDRFMPSGILADSFYVKGSSRTEALLDTVAQLLRTWRTRDLEHLQKDPCSGNGEPDTEKIGGHRGPTRRFLDFL